MKKIFAITLAAIALFALASCNKETLRTVEYEQLKYEALAFKCEVPTDVATNPLNFDLQVSEFEITPDGGFILQDANGLHTGEIENIDEVSEEAPKGEETTVICKGWGDVTLALPLEEVKASSGITIKFKPKGFVAPIVVTATPVTKPNINAEFLMKIGRKWTITNTTVSATGGDLGDKLAAALNFPGECDLAAIKADLESRTGKTFDMGDVSGYVVDYIELTPFSFIVHFKNSKETVQANMPVINATSADHGTFEYQVNAKQKGVSIFYGKANGEINFDKKGNCELKINADIDHSNTAYKGTVVFKLKKIQ